MLSKNPNKKILHLSREVALTASPSQAFDMQVPASIRIEEIHSVSFRANTLLNVGARYADVTAQCYLRLRGKSVPGVTDPGQVPGINQNYGTIHINGNNPQFYWGLGLKTPVNNDLEIYIIFLITGALYTALDSFQASVTLEYE